MYTLTCIKDHAVMFMWPRIESISFIDFFNLKKKKKKVIYLLKNSFSFIPLSTTLIIEKQWVHTQWLMMLPDHVHNYLGKINACSQGCESWEDGILKAVDNIFRQ